MEQSEESRTPGGGGGNLMLASLRRVLLAGIGMFVLAQEEIEEFVRWMIDRGDIAEDEGRRLVDDVVEQRTERLREARSGLGGTIDRSTEEVYRRFNIPSRSEIAVLSEQIAELAKKVDELTERTQQ